MSDGEEIKPHVFEVPGSGVRFVKKDADHYRSRIVTTEKFPTRMAEHVEINPEAAQFLRDEQKYLATPDFILNSVVLTVPREEVPKDGQKNILVPAIFGRAASPVTGRIPYAGLMGEQIVFKGVGMSGDRYPDNPDTDKWMFEGHWTNSENPTGYLIQSENYVDVNISNQLLGLGARSSLNLGTIILSEHELRAQIEKTWGARDKEVAKMMIRALDNRLQGESKDSKLAISARVGGVPQRLGAFLPYVNYALGSDSNTMYLENLLRANIRHSARLMRDESREFPDKFSRYLRQTSISQASSNLDHIANGKLITTEDIEVLTEVLCGMAVTDRNIIAKLGERNSDFKSLYKYYPAVKDIDFSFIHYDYDVIEPGLYERDRLGDISNRFTYDEDTARYLGYYPWATEELFINRGQHPEIDNLHKYKIKIGTALSNY